MKILQVATLITPENAYGGPTTVALNQCRALRDAGHEVVLAAGAQGFEGGLPDDFQGVDVRLFPALQVIPGTGFAGLATPSMMAWLAREAARFDAAHVHLARDFITLPAASLLQNLGVPVCAQPHGMIDASTKALSVPLDAVLTRRVLRAARRVFHLTDLERAGLVEVAGHRLRLEELHNGFDASTMLPPQEHERTTVLYLGRLHPRKRPVAFVEAATLLLDELPGVDFRLVGPDEGEGEQVKRLIASAGHPDRIVWDGPADREGCRRAMATADLYVLPSIAETYPMGVLEAMAAGLPVVITDTNGLAPAVSAGGAGEVTGGDPSEVAAAIRRLLADPDRRRAMGDHALRLAREAFSMEPIVDQLLTAYRTDRRRNLHVG